MTDTAPLVHSIERNVANAAAGSDLETDVMLAPFAGTITKVVYVPSTTITGANTDSRTCKVVNKGAAGSGTAAPATKAFTSGVNATADEETDFTLSATASDLLVTAGDILVWQSNHVGSTGLADPGGMVHIELTRS